MLKKSKIKITANQHFDTEYEQNCIATSDSDQFGNFTALDSDGVECEFFTSMIRDIRDE